MNSSKSKNFRYFKEINTSKTNDSPRQNAKKGTKRTQRMKTRTKSLKKQIRDTQRLLSKNILNEDALSAQQKKLERLKRAQLVEKRLKIRSKRAKKYRGVKYFDSRKVLKKLTSLAKLINDPVSDRDNKDEGVRDFTLYKRYLNYITYFPSESKYISLFPNSERLDPNAQNQIDTLISEINSKVMEGLYADSWGAHLAKTSTTLSPSLQQPITSEEETLTTDLEVSDSPTSKNISTSDFIPIEVEGSQVRNTSAVKKKHSLKKILKTENLRTIVDSPTPVAPSLDNSTQMEMEDNLKNDDFFFYDNKGSEIDTSIFRKRPQRRNFQENKNRTDNSINSKQKSKYRQTKNKRR